jgi:integrase
MLGHSSPTITMNVYSHALPTARKEAAETLGRLLG